MVSDRSSRAEDWTDLGKKSMFACLVQNIQKNNKYVIQTDLYLEIVEKGTFCDFKITLIRIQISLFILI